MVASRHNPGVLWVHNDRARGQIYAIGINGALLATWDVGKTVDDVEDIAIGPGPAPELDYLYVGDIGDNAAVRESIRVIRAAEPSVYRYQAAKPTTPNFPLVEKITLVYPDGSHNAEELMVDPWTGDLFIATKESGITRLYRATQAQLIDGATVTLEFILELEFHIVSAGDISPDGREIVLRQEEFAELWTRAPGQTVAQALGGTPTYIPVIGTPVEPNGEAITFASDGLGYYTISEGVQPVVYYFARTNHFPNPSTQSLLASASVWKYQDDGTDQGANWIGIDFADATWSSGVAQLGYGDGDENTLIRYGSNKDQKQTTSYFRTQFAIEDPTLFRALSLTLVYDDGVAVYLNGAEVLRKNLAAGAKFSTAALSSGSSAENLWQTFEIPNRLRAGTNTLAVEVHRHSRSEGDLSFDLQLLGIRAETTLQFTSPPRRTSAGTWSVDFQAPEAAATYLEASTNLRDWTPIGSPVASDGVGTIAIAVETTGGKFYRLRQ